MATIVVPNFNTAKSYVGLNSYVYTVTQAGVSTATLQVSPRASSTLTASITQAGSATASSSVTLNSIPTTNPSHICIVRLTMNLAVGDTVTYALTSSATIDQELNTTETIINFLQGQVN